MIQEKSQQLDHQNRVAIIIQKWVRGTQSRIRTFQLAKQAQYRHRVLQQIMDTQQNYIRDLGFIISDFKMRLISEKILSASQAQRIFSNIEQIHKLNQQFYASVYMNYQNYTHYKCVFKDTHKFVFFFKIYFQYFNNFQSACTIVQQLRKNRSKFREILNQLYHNKKFRSLSIEDYIVKPIQRLPKYVILFKELKKRTSNQHPDYSNICHLLQAFEVVNISNNEKLNKILNNYKLAQIEEVMGLRDITLPGVDFAGEEPVTALTYDNKTVDSILYLLNNQFILRKARTNKLLARILISHGASLIENQNQFYYQNLITVQSHQGDSFTLLCLNSQEKQSLFNRLSYLIFSAQKSTIDKALLLFKSNVISDSFAKRLNLMELMPDVTVLGTSEREARVFKYTVYIIEIKIKNVKQKIFLRFSEVLQIQKLIQSQFPEIEIKQGLLATTWLLNHKPRTIQQRKMNIQRFVKQILSKQQIMQKGHLILFRLGLPFDFYDLPRKFKENYELSRSSILQKSHSSNKSRIKSSTIFCGRYSLFKGMEEDQEVQQPNVSECTVNINDLLKANENQLGHYTRFSEAVDTSKIQMNIPNIELTVYIPWIQSWEGFKKIHVQLKAYQRVQLLICLVSRKIGLNYFKDFRLFLERNYKERVLDDDEIVSKIEEQLRQGEYRIVLKKMIYIAKDTQLRQMKRDKIRLKIIASQTIYDACRGRYALKYKNYLIFACLVGIILQINFQPIKNLPIVTKNLVLPQHTFIEEIQQWDSDYHILYEELLKKLKRIQQANKKLKNQEKPNQFFDDLSCLVHYSILNQLQDNILHGTYPFMVQLSTQFHEYLMQIHQLQQTNRNVFLAIKHASIMIVSMCMSTVYFEFGHNQVLQTETFPGSILISLKNGVQVELKTTSSYFIRELLVYYRNYRAVWQRIVKDPMFRQSILETSQKDSNQFQNIMIE